MEVEQTVKRMRGGSTFNVLNPQIGLKTIECSVAFLGNSAYEIQLARSALRAALIGKLELYFGFDGFYYTAALDGESDIESEGNQVEVTKLKFSGIQHGPETRTSTNPIICASTVPETSAIFSGVASATSGKIAGVKFSGLTTGAKIEVDGINCRILVDGAPLASRFELHKFPTLRPGVNAIDNEGISSFSARYFPTYI